MSITDEEFESARLSPPEKVVHFVIPGWVTSINDGDRHYVPAKNILRLCRLRPSRDRIYIFRGADDLTIPGLREHLLSQGFIVLTHEPSRKGNYCGRGEGHR